MLQNWRPIVILIPERCCNTLPLGAIPHSVTRYFKNISVGIRAVFPVSCIYATVVRCSQILPRCVCGALCLHSLQAQCERNVCECKCSCLLSMACLQSRHEKRIWHYCAYIANSQGPWTLRSLTVKDVLNLRTPRELTLPTWQSISLTHANLFKNRQVITW